MIIKTIVTPAANEGFCSLSDLKDMLGISGVSKDAILTTIIKRASALIEDFCGRKFETQRIIEKVKPERDFTVIKLGAFPVIAVHAVNYKGVAVDAAEYSSDRKQYGFLDSADGYFWNPCGRIFDYEVEYTYGYNCPEDLPLPIQQACIQLAKMAYLTKSQHPGVKVIEVPEVYRVAFAGGDLPNTSFNALMSNDVKMLLQPYKVYRI